MTKLAAINAVRLRRTFSRFPGNEIATDRENLDEE